MNNLKFWNIGEKISLREAFGRILVYEAKKRDDFVLFDADVAGGTGAKPFVQEFPGRVMQFGIAEQNMMATAGGFSDVGIIPVVSTFAVFGTMRAHEQFRTVIAYPNRNGKFYGAGICDSFFSNEIKEFKEYNPVEIFNVSPSQQNELVVNNVYQLLEKVARSLGINWGPVGGDFVLTDSGLKIIEIAPRLYGPNGSLQIFPASTGIQPLEFMVQCVAGDNPNLEYLKPKFNKVALCKVFISRRQDIRDIKFNTDPKKLEGLFSWFIYWSKNEKAVRSKTALSGLASVFVIGEDYEEAMSNLKIVEDAFEIR